MNGTLADLRYALRQFARRPAFYGLVAGILALGIGANAAMFTLADAALFRPLPIHEQERVVRLFVSGKRDDTQINNGSYPQYEDLARARPGLSDVAAFSEMPVHATPGSGAPERVLGGVASGAFFDVLGMKPAMGRFIAPADDKPFDGEPVVVVSDHYWRSRLDAAPDAIGRKITINRVPFTVIGVAPAGFTGLNLESAVELWLPMGMVVVAGPGLATPERIRNRGFSWLDFVGRIAPGRDRKSFEAELDAFSARMNQELAGSEQRGQGDWYRAIDARAAAVDVYGTQGIARNAWLLSGVVALLLALAAANVGGMLAARGEERAGELAVRLGLGASRARVVRQLLTECALLAAFGIVAGLLVARVVLVQIAGSAPEGVILPIDPASAVLDGRVLLAAVASALVAVFSAGIVPALRAVRVELAPVLKGSAATATRGALARSWRGALVALQVGLSTMLLVAAGLLLQAFSNTAHIAPGFDPAGGLTFSVDLARHGVPKERLESEFERLQQRVRSLPGVRSAAWSNAVPVRDGGMRTSIQVGGEDPKAPPRHVNLVVIGEGYLDTLGLKLRAGRMMPNGPDAGPEVVINQAMAEQFWPGQDPLGRKITNQASDRGGAVVVGVVSNNKQRSLREADAPILYMPFREFRSGNMSMLVRTDGDPAALGPTIERALHELEPDLPLLRMRTLEDNLAASYSQARLFAYLVSAYALLAAVLAGAGLYGVLSSALTSRTREIGLRVALGASRERVATLVLADSATVIVAGLALGIAGALALSRTLGDLLFGVGDRDPATLALVCVAIAVVGLAASAWPLRRALAIEPMVALRHE